MPFSTAHGIIIVIMIIVTVDRFLEIVRLLSKFHVSHEALI